MDPRIIAGLVIVSLAATVGWTTRGWLAGNQIKSMRLQVLSAENLALQWAADASKAMQSVSDAVASSVLADMELLDAQERIAELEARKYEATDNADCAANADWMRTVDSALSDTARAAAGAYERADEITEITNADTARIIQSNYLTCQRDQSRLQGWQDFYSGVKADYETAADPSPVREFFSRFR